jgi:hypothetical protein
LFDHVQIAVASLDEASDSYARHHGLNAVAGGRHPGRGTANSIVPLGDAYLELIAVVDAAEAVSQPQSQRVARAVQSGRTFPVWIVRTNDLDSMRSYLTGAGFRLPPPTDGWRRRPDGVELSWRTQELVPDAEFSSLPFLIEWRLEPGLHPGATPSRHRARPRGVAQIVLSDPDPASAEARLRLVIGDDVAFTVERGEPGVRAVVLDTERGPLTLM